MPFPLNHVSSAIEDSSINGKASSLSKCLEDVSFVGELSSCYSFNFEPAAGMLSWISFRLSSILVVVLVDAETGIVSLHDKGIFVALVDDGEALGGVVCEWIDDQTVIVGGDC